MYTIVNSDNPQQLRESLIQNRESLLKLVDDWHYFNTVEHSRLELEYNQLFGDLESQLCLLNAEMQSVQDKIDSLSYKASNNQISESSKKESNSAKTATLYRKIVKKLHPDCCEDLELNFKYWDKVQSAYKSKNDRHLEIIFDTITCDYQNLEKSQIKREIRKIEVFIEDEKDKLTRLKLEEPFIYDKKLNDGFWINKRKKSLEMKLINAEQKLSLKKKIYDNMKRRKMRNPFVN